MSLVSNLVNFNINYIPVTNGQFGNYYDPLISKDFPSNVTEALYLAREAMNMKLKSSFEMNNDIYTILRLKLTQLFTKCDKFNCKNQIEYVIELGLMCHSQYRRHRQVIIEPPKILKQSTITIESSTTIHDNPECTYNFSDEQYESKHSTSHPFGNGVYLPTSDSVNCALVDLCAGSGKTMMVIFGNIVNAYLTFQYPSLFPIKPASFKNKLYNIVSDGSITYSFVPDTDVKYLFSMTSFIFCSCALLGQWVNFIQSIKLPVKEIFDIEINVIVNPVSGQTIPYPNYFEEESNKVLFVIISNQSCSDEVIEHYCHLYKQEIEVQNATDHNHQPEEIIQKQEKKRKIEIHSNDSVKKVSTIISVCCLGSLIQDEIHNNMSDKINERTSKYASIGRNSYIPSFCRRFNMVICVSATYSQKLGLTNNSIDTTIYRSHTTPDTLFGVICPAALRNVHTDKHLILPVDTVRNISQMYWGKGILLQFLEDCKNTEKENPKNTIHLPDSKLLIDLLQIVKYVRFNLKLDHKKGIYGNFEELYKDFYSVSTLLQVVQLYQLVELTLSHLIHYHHAAASQLIAELSFAMPDSKIVMNINQEIDMFMSLIPSTICSFQSRPIPNNIHETDYDYNNNHNNYNTKVTKVHLFLFSRGIYTFATNKLNCESIFRRLVQKKSTDYCAICMINIKSKINNYALSCCFKTICEICYKQYYEDNNSFDDSISRYQLCTLIPAVVCNDDITLIDANVKSKLSLVTLCNGDKVRPHDLSPSLITMSACIFHNSCKYNSEYDLHTCTTKPEFMESTNNLLLNLFVSDAKKNINDLQNIEKNNGNIGYGINNNNYNTNNNTSKMFLKNQQTITRSFLNNDDFYESLFYVLVGIKKQLINRALSVPVKIFIPLSTSIFEKSTDSETFEKFLLLLIQDIFSNTILEKPPIINTMGYSTRKNNYYEALQNFNTTTNHNFHFLVCRCDNSVHNLVDGLDLNKTDIIWWITGDIDDQDFHSRINQILGRGSRMSNATAEMSGKNEKSQNTLLLVTKHKCQLKKEKEQTKTIK